MNNWDTIWINAQLLTMVKTGVAYGFIDNGAIACKNGKITWLGSMNDFVSLKYSSNTEIIDCEHRFITPGLIDCHTHIIYAGNRANEFEQRLHGISYETIAQGGGGIEATVKSTREATQNSLYKSAIERLQYLINDGVTTVEIKSGYGLNLASELKMLRVADKIDKALPINIIPTLLAAHTVPFEYKKNPDAYIELICTEIIPIVAKENLATAVDGFCETIAFSNEQISAVFTSAKNYGLEVKLHADQFSNSEATKLAAKFKALSADHLEYTSESGVKAMADNHTVAVLLPGAYYYLGETQIPPVESLRKYNVPIAVASDSNPGSSPVLSLLCILNMACVLFKLTPEEALLGVTKHAAMALGIYDHCGTLEPGKDADFVLWEIDHPSELVYSLGYNPCYCSVKSGRVIYRN